MNTEENTDLKNAEIFAVELFALANAHRNTVTNGHICTALCALVGVMFSELPEEARIIMLSRATHCIADAAGIEIVDMQVTKEAAS